MKEQRVKMEGLEKEVERLKGEVKVQLMLDNHFNSLHFLKMKLLST